MSNPNVIVHHATRPLPFLEKGRLLLMDYEVWQYRGPGYWARLSAPADALEGSPLDRTDVEMGLREFTVLPSEARFSHLTAPPEISSAEAQRRLREITEEAVSTAIAEIPLTVADRKHVENAVQLAIGHAYELGRRRELYPTTD